jgi:hypothetical protein
MTGTKFGQGTRGRSKIRNGDFLGDLVETKIFFAIQTKGVLIHENN